MIIPSHGNHGLPSNLYIAVPHGKLVSTSCFLRIHGDELIETGINDHYSLSDVLSFSKYSNSGKRITIAESPHKDSFLSVVLGSLHTSVMNFITFDDIYCLYPTLMPSMKTCCFCGVQGLTDFECSTIQSQGFNLVTASAFLMGSCNNICPLFVQQFHGLQCISVFHWNRLGSSDFNNLLYLWTLGDLCTKDDCSTQAHAKLLNFSF